MTFAAQGIYYHATIVAALAMVFVRDQTAVSLIALSQNLALDL